MVLAQTIPIRIATGPSYGLLVDPKRPDGGFLTSRIQRIFQDMRMKPAVDFVPWKRAYAETLKGSYAATFPWYQNSERERDFLFTNSIHAVMLVAVVKSNSALKQIDHKAVRHRKTCDVLGSNLYRDLQKTAKLQLLFVGEYDQCFQMLLSERIDFLLMHRETAERNQHPLIRSIPNRLINVQSMHVMIPRNQDGARELVKDFNRSLRKLTAMNVFDPSADR